MNICTNPEYFALSAVDAAELLTDLGAEPDFAVRAIERAHDVGKHRASFGKWHTQIDHAGDWRFIVSVHARRTVPSPPAQDATRYNYRVAWSAEDGEHVATVAEFPSLSVLAPTQGEALAGITQLVRDTLADIAASGHSAPAPQRTEYKPVSG